VEKSGFALKRQTENPQSLQYMRFSEFWRILKKMSFLKGKSVVLE